MRKWVCADVHILVRSEGRKGKKKYTSKGGSVYLNIAA